MKTKLLFVIDSLICAGAEKSLVSLLNQLDYHRYEVDLQLFAYGGEFETFLPKEVNLLPPLSYTTFLGSSFWCQLQRSLFHSKERLMLYSKWKYSFLLKTRKHLNNKQIAHLYWETISPCIQPSNQKYDVAIAYAQGVPTFYVVDKIKATKKCAWINATYDLSACEKKYQQRFYQCLDKIVTVSESAHSIFKSVYPQFWKKMFIIKDIIDVHLIQQLSKQNTGYKDGYNGIRILTVGRLNKFNKGFDLTLQACKILKEKGILFRWYALGKGNYEQEMREFIAKNHLESDFVLLGTTVNPYPYFKQSTLYVQTSRHEGYGLSIAEARLLNVPVVTTEFDAVYNQMVPEQNGLVVPQDPEAVADAIVRILNDKALYNHIVDYLKTERKGNIEELDKFYSLIEK